MDPRDTNLTSTSASTSSSTSSKLDATAVDPGRTVLVGVLGGILSAAGYLVYQRLPDDQRERLHRQVRGVLETRLAELRQNFNI